MARPESPTARIDRLVREECARRGWVEDKWEAKFKTSKGYRKKDGYGWIDFVALQTEPSFEVGATSDQPAIIGIQATSKGNLRSRVKKSADLAVPWISAGGIALAWGFDDNDELTEVDLAEL